MKQAQRLQQTQRVAQGQALVMTPQLTQSIKLLAMSAADLDAFVAEEVERNPLLREAPRPLPGSVAVATTGETAWETVAERATLTGYLSLQIAASALPRDVCALAREIAFDLRPNGYLDEPEATCRRLGSPPGFAKALALLRSLEPTGVGAQNLADCLSLQLAARDRLDPAMRTLLDHLPLVAAGDRSALCEASGLDDEDLSDALRELRALDPQPGLRFADAHATAAPPDMLMRRDARGGWVVEVNPAVQPRVLVDRTYAAHVMPMLRKVEDRAYLGEALQGANWLVRALDQRARTMTRVTAAIVAAQDAFFEHGAGALKPLTMQTIADAAKVHESTVSRVVNAKTLDAPGGMVALRSFFSAALGSEHCARAVQERIRTMVGTEGARPLSDDAIAARLLKEGVEIARRTVAKYREGLGIPSSTKRRRMIAPVGGGRIAAAATM